MAAPTHTTRTVPTGNWISDGYEVHIAFSSNPSVEVWEKEITPPGWDNGEPRIVTNQFSGTRVQKSPNATTNVTDGQATCHYDPGNLSEIRAMVGLRQTITYTYPEGTQYSEYGYIKSAVPGPLARGTEPIITLSIVHTSTDPATCDAADGLITVGTGTQNVC